LLDGYDPKTLSVCPDQEDFAGADPLVTTKLSSYSSTVLAGSGFTIL
jgi:hypothetical protein